MFTACSSGRTLRSQQEYLLRLPYLCNSVPGRVRTHIGFAVAAAAALSHDPLTSVPTYLTHANHLCVGQSCAEKPNAGVLCEPLCVRAAAMLDSKTEQAL